MEGNSPGSSAGGRLGLGQGSDSDRAWLLQDKYVTVQCEAARRGMGCSSTALLFQLLHLSPTIQPIPTRPKRVSAPQRPRLPDPIPADWTSENFLGLEYCDNTCRVFILYNINEQKQNYE